MELNITRERINSLHTEIMNGLTGNPKYLPSKLFYDERGSQIFDRICQLDEYYPTRTERSILINHIHEIAEYCGKDIILIEPGSGSSKKIRILLDHFDSPAAYVPVDISGKHLHHSVNVLQKDHPDLRIIPVVADYTHPFTLPDFPFDFSHKVLFYPGSTIGNFKPEQAIQFLKLCSGLIGKNGSIIIGVDLLKDIPTLEAAYNDQEGVTAAFNRNILNHVNRLLDIDFIPDLFEHKAYFNESESRIEMHLISTCDQTISCNGKEIHFYKGESIHTENSYKYSLEAFSTIASSAGFDVIQTWTDKKEYFSVQYLSLR